MENLALRGPRLVGGGKRRGHRLWEVPLLVRADLKPMVKKMRTRVVVTAHGDAYEGDDEEAYVCEGFTMAKEVPCTACSCMMIPKRVLQPADFITVVRVHEGGCRHNVKEPLQVWMTKADAKADLKDLRTDLEVVRALRKVGKAWVLPDSCGVLESRVDLVI